MSNNLTFGIAIPTYAKHLQYLDHLLDSINSSTVLPDHVVVSCSSVDHKKIELKQYNFPLTLIITNKYQNPSKNRNIAAKNLDTEIISFIDGDDAVHPIRTEVLKNAFKGECKVICHNYIQSATLVALENHIIPDVKIYHHFINISHPLLAFPISIHGHQDYHCAHVTLRKSIFDAFLYDEAEVLKYTEDAEFLKRLVNAGVFIDYIPTALSFYRK